MNLIELIDMFPRDDLALVFRCILDRVPVIVGGHDANLINQIVMKLVDFFPFRKEMVYGTDFLKREEYDSIVQEECMDYDQHKILIRAPTHLEESILEHMDDLRGWIIAMCVDGDIDGFYENASRLRAKSLVSSFVYFNKNAKMQFTRYFNGNRITNIETRLERNLLKRTLSQTSITIEKIKRVLDKKITNKSDINESILNSLVDLSQEEEIIKENMLKKEFTEFYQAARRGLAVLSRLNFLNQFHPVRIGKKTFFDAVSYNESSTGRFLDFVRSEWGESFDDLIDDSKISALGDHLDGLWG